jgi:hypothetical protein
MIAHTCAGTRDMLQASARGQGRGRPDSGTGTTVEENTPAAPTPPTLPPPDFPESAFLSEITVRKNFPDAAFKTAFDTVVADFPGGSARSNQVGQNPFLGSLPGEGLSQLVLTLNGCGVNGLHVHPRGTESVFMVTGARPRCIATACQ